MLGLMLRATSPHPRIGTGPWLTSVLWPLVAACTGHGAEPVSSPTTSHGDERREIFELDNPALVRVAEQSVVALVNADRISDDGKLQDGLPTLREKFNYCPSYPFAQELSIARCSAVLVANDVVMTARHCFMDPYSCDATRFVFGLYDEAPNQMRKLSPDDVYRCGELIEPSSDSGDYVFVRLARPVVPPRAPVALGPIVGIGLRLHVSALGFPRGMPMKLSPGVVSEVGARFMISSQIAPGNSGGPVCDDDGRLLGLTTGGAQGTGQDPFAVPDPSDPSCNTDYKGPDDKNGFVQSLDLPLHDICAGPYRLSSCGEIGL